LDRRCCILLDGTLFPAHQCAGHMSMFVLQVIGLIAVASMPGVDTVILLDYCTSRPPKPASSARPPGNMGQLILERASASHPSGQRSDDDFAVLADCRRRAYVGRILKVHAAPVGTPWMLDTGLPAPKAGAVQETSSAPMC
jgi:hypothetical protein